MLKLHQGRTGGPLRIRQAWGFVGKRQPPANRFPSRMLLNLQQPVATVSSLHLSCLRIQPTIETMHSTYPALSRILIINITDTPVDARLTRHFQSCQKMLHRLFGDHHG